MQSPQAEWPVLSGRIPPLADSLIPRQEIGLSLASSLPAGEAVVLVPDDAAAGPELRGLGGTGKTSFAAALAQAHRRSRLADLVVWVTATGRDAVVSSYAQALHDIGMPVPGDDPEHAAASFLTWLRHTRQPWLVVLDGLSDALVIDELWPDGPSGRVLVTTEHPGLASRIANPHLVTVGPYSPREALGYLFGKLHADPGQRAGALDLASGLGLLPFALEQAAALMTETGMDCRQYLARAAAGGSDQTAPAGQPAPLIGQAWSLSAEYADQLQPAGLARRVLTFISMLSPGGIPGALLTSEAAQAHLTGRASGGPAGAGPIRAAVHNLARAGLVTVDADSAARTVLVHPVVQALTRQRLTGAEFEQAARTAGETLVQAWLWPDAPPAIAQALRDCTAQLRDVSGSVLWAPECQLALLRAGQSLDSSRMASSAAGYWRMMLGISQRGLGPEHAQTVLVSDLLGAACQAAGRFDEAIAVFQGALADRERSLGPDNQGTVAARLNLTRAYRAAGRADEAVRLATQVVAESERGTGPSHPDSLTAQEEVVRACLSAGQFSEAVVTAAQLRAAREQALGREHPDTLAANDLLAEAYLAARRFKDAIALRRRALADRERTHGPGHEDTVAARARLAQAYQLADKPKDAMAQHERVLADRERVQGPDHPDTIAARAELALACYAARRLPQSIKLYERVVADCERLFGPADPRTRRAQQDLSEAGAGAQSILGIDLRSPVRRG